MNLVDRNLMYNDRIPHESQTIHGSNIDIYSSYVIEQLYS